MTRCMRLNTVLWIAARNHFHSNRPCKWTVRISAAKMSISQTQSTKIMDSHLHVWASPQEAASKFPYFPGEEPTLPGHVDFLLQCPEEIPNQVCWSLANPAEDGSGLVEFEHLVLKDGYRAARFNPYLWPSGEKMTNDVGKAIFSRAGELKIPVGFMCMKGLDLHISEIEELCTQFPSTVVMLDHLAFCKPPINVEESQTFFRLLNLSRFPQVYIKFSALFRVSRLQFPYLDLSPLLSQVVSSFGANRVMWGSDFPYIVPECGYKGGKEAVHLIANQVSLSSSDLEWIMGRTAAELFQIN